MDEGGVSTASEKSEAPVFPPPPKSHPPPDFAPPPSVDPPPDANHLTTLAFPPNFTLPPVFGSPPPKNWRSPDRLVLGPHPYGSERESTTLQLRFRTRFFRATATPIDGVHNNGMLLRLPPSKLQTLLRVVLCRLLSFVQNWYEWLFPEIALSHFQNILGRRQSRFPPCWRQDHDGRPGEKRRLESTARLNSSLVSTRIPSIAFRRMFLSRLINRIHDTPGLRTDAER
ncbi:hypothetical protein L209DRAFT_756743 [Thermothelomyces heterothallicus CBS 203.75]